MKRRWMRYLAALLLTVLSAAGACGEGYQRVVYEGVEYEYNPQVTAILYAGVDSDGEMRTTDRYTIAPRADTINLIVLDGYHKRIRILAISRDTMTGIGRYTMDGSWRDSYVSHLGYAYTYGDGGKVSCENLVQAVSELLCGVPIQEYLVTNESGIALGNARVGGVEVTVPNDDVVHLHPELSKGARVTLNDENVVDYVMYRDTSIAFTNNGRMERQREFIMEFIRKLQQRAEHSPEQLWRDVEGGSAYMQTSIGRNEYLSLVQKIGGATLAEDGYLYLGGFDAEQEEYDVYYLNASEILPVVIDLFYLER